MKSQLGVLDIKILHGKVDSMKLLMLRYKQFFVTWITCKITCLKLDTPRVVNITSQLTAFPLRLQIEQVR